MGATGVKAFITNTDKNSCKANSKHPLPHFIFKLAFILHSESE